MAIEAPVGGTPTLNSSANTNCVVAYPAGIAADDQFIAYVGHSSTTAVAEQAGWTTLISGTSGGSSPSFKVFRKTVRATGSESGTVSFDTANVQNQGVMYRVRGVDTTNPVDVTGTVFGSSAATTAYNIPTLTTTMTGVLLMYFGGANVSGAGTFTPPTVPATFTEQHDNNTATPHSTAGYLIWSGSGATGTINLVRGTALRGFAGAIALRPTVAAAPPSRPNIHQSNPATLRSYLW